MSLLTGAKEIHKAALPILADKSINKKIPRIIRRISALMMLFVLFLHYWNILSLIPLVQIPLWDPIFSSFLEESILYTILGWFLYEIIFYKLLTWIFCYIESIISIQLTKYWASADDIIEISLSLIIFLFSINSFINFSHGISIPNNNLTAFYLAGLYLVAVFIRWIYVKNCIWQKAVQTEYTDFYDRNGKRIAKDDYVIYYHRRYKVDKTETFHTKNRLKSQEWIIHTESSIGTSLCHPLERVVNDKDGNLIIDSQKV